MRWKKSCAVFNWERSIRWIPQKSRWAHRPPSNLPTTQLPYTNDTAFQPPFSPYFRLGSSGICPFFVFIYDRGNWVSMGRSRGDGVFLSSVSDVGALVSPGIFLPCPKHPSDFFKVGNPALLCKKNLGNAYFCIFVEGLPELYDKVSFPKLRKHQEWCWWLSPVTFLLFSFLFFA